MQQYFFIIRAVLRHCLRAVLAHANAVAVAAGGYHNALGRYLYCERGAVQPQCLPELAPGNGFAAKLKPCHAAAFAFESIFTCSSSLFFDISAPFIAAFTAFANCLRVKDTVAL